jgi:hypothetical protein
MTRLGLVRAVRAAAALLVLMPTLSWAQSGIAGVVKDTGGAVMPGVTVEAASPALIEKIRTVVTDDQGQYKIVDLRPGPYTVTFTLPGFSTVKRDGINLPDAFTATVNADMSVGALEETITVSGEAPLVDVQNVQQRRVLDNELTDSIPTIRFVHNYATLIPGVTGTSFTSNGTDQRHYWVHGGRDNESLILVDGISTMFLSGGGSSYFMNSAWSQEINVQSSGNPAEMEYGGVISNVIPKEGSNSMSYYFYGNYTNENMQQSNIDDDLRSRGLTEGTKNFINYDIDPGMGGKIIRDKLWFYVAAESSVVDRSRAGVYFNATPLAWVYTPDLDRPAHNKNSDYDWGARLTYQLSPRNKFSAFWDQQIHYYHHRGSDSGPGSVVPAPEATEYTPEWPNYVASLVYKSPVTNRLLIDVGAGMYATSIPTKPQRFPGYDNWDPWSLVAALDTAINTCFRVSGAPGCGTWSEPWNRNGSGRASLSYVTGSHAFKAGFQWMYANTGNQGILNKEYSFRLTNGTPNRVNQSIKPNRTDVRGREFSWFAQDQWTRNKFTFNLGVRLDHQNGWVPESHNDAGIFVPLARDFPRKDDLGNYTDVSPRFGVAYDVFGNGRTALKATANRYLTKSLNIAASANNPMGALSVTSVTRNWGDADRDYEPDCDLANPQANGECGIISNLNFGQPNPANLGYNSDILQGWGQRNYNWEISAQIDHQLTSTVSINIGYFRRQYFNFLVTDNLAVEPADYTPYCVQAPSHPALPGGGGYQVCDLYDISNAKVNVPTRNQVNDSEKYGDRTENWNGLDFMFASRFGRGGTFSGGLSTGRTHTNNCNIVDLPVIQYCDTLEPFQTQLKLVGRYPLPLFGIEFSGTLQNVPGDFLTATAVYNSASIQTGASGANAVPLGRPLAAGGTVTVNLIAPDTVQLPRKTQVDFRFGKSFRRGKLNVTPSVDLINMLNANSVEAFNDRVNATYPGPVRTQFGRFARVNILINY